MIETALWRAPKTHSINNRDQSLFYIACPTYTEFSSGVRCLYHLCHHLNRLGYKAFVTGAGAPPSLLAPRINIRLIEANRRLGIDDIVVYPEVIVGNPLGGGKVVRYLLNKPGLLNSFDVNRKGSIGELDHGVGMAGYGMSDFFIHFAEEFCPDGLQSFRLRLPLIDPGIFRERSPQPHRRGFILYSRRHTPDLSTLPAWVSPYTMVSMANPRSPAELAALYQDHVALVLWERSAAVAEALQCGCPVILIPSPTFQTEPIVGRYHGNGFVVGWNEAALTHAKETVKIAARQYWHRYRSLDSEIHEFVRRAKEHFA